MRDDYDDNDQPTREEILERYGWKPGEKEQLEREQVARAQQIKSAETLARCEQRAERPRTPVVERSYGQKSQDEAAAVKYWQGYIRDQLDSANLALTKAVADAVVTEERHRDQADFELRTIIIDVRDRFDEMDQRMNELEARISKRGPAIKCDGNARAFDVDRLRGEWRH